MMLRPRPGRSQPSRVLADRSNVPPPITSRIPKLKSAMAGDAFNGPPPSLTYGKPVRAPPDWAKIHAREEQRKATKMAALRKPTTVPDELTLQSNLHGRGATRSRAARQENSQENSQVGVSPDETALQANALEQPGLLRAAPRAHKTSALGVLTGHQGRSLPTRPPQLSKPSIQLPSALENEDPLGFKIDAAALRDIQQSGSIPASLPTGRMTLAGGERMHERHQELLQSRNAIQDARNKRMSMRALLESTLRDVAPFAAEPITPVALRHYAVPIESDDFVSSTRSKAAIFYDPTEETQTVKTAAEITDFARRASVHMGALRVGRKLPNPPTQTTINLLNATTPAIHRGNKTATPRSVSQNQFRTARRAELSEQAADWHVNPRLPLILQLEEAEAELQRMVEEEEERIRKQLEIALGRNPAVNPAKPTATPRVKPPAMVPSANAEATMAPITPMKKETIATARTTIAKVSRTPVSMARPLQGFKLMVTPCKTPRSILNPPPRDLLPPAPLVFGLAANEGDFSLELQRIGMLADLAGACLPGARPPGARPPCALDRMMTNRFVPISPPPPTRPTLVIDVAAKTLRQRGCARDSQPGPSPGHVGQVRTAFRRLL